MPHLDLDFGSPNKHICIICNLVDAIRATDVCTLDVWKKVPSQTLQLIVYHAVAKGILNIHYQRKFRRKLPSYGN